ncbi:MAG: glucose/sorbosone family PQQ-dependent dehydrogenase, partial [Bacteroidota bacterium]
MIRYLPLLLCFYCTTLTAQNERFEITPLGNGRQFDSAWDLEYGPDDYLWVSERELGQLVRIDPETAARDVLLTITDVYANASQDGLLGFALHPALRDTAPYVYLSYTYQVNDERQQRLVRYTYQETMDGTDGTLSDPIILLEGMPASNDHNSGRLIYGPDAKLYYTIGDQGGNQGRNYCNRILSQVLPTQAEVDAQDWRNYPGKTLRLNLNGSIPDDNPLLNGVRSHVFTYGHRNAQGIVFGRNGRLYSDEHGPDTDDEVNVLTAGKNYGWPRVVGFRDDQAYDFCDWSTLSNCPDLEYDKFNCPDDATFQEESTLTDTNYQEPLYAMFAVTDDYDFNGPGCADSWVCRPNVAPSSIAIYESDGIPAWNNSLLVVSLKRGYVYRLQLNDEGTAVVGDTTRHFYTG